jgi:hypothetical protein
LQQQQQQAQKQRQQGQQQQTKGSSLQDAPGSGSKHTRVTYKVTLTQCGVGMGWDTDTMGGVRGIMALLGFATLPCVKLRGSNELFRGIAMP